MHLRKAGVCVGVRANLRVPGMHGLGMRMRLDRSDLFITPP
jgi:hypothetical protein